VKPEVSGKPEIDRAPMMPQARGLARVGLVHDHRPSLGIHPARPIRHHSLSTHDALEHRRPPHNLRDRARKVSPRQNREGNDHADNEQPLRLLLASPVAPPLLSNQSRIVYVPVPDSDTVRGVPVTLFAMLKMADLLFATLGLNVTFTVQEPPAANVSGQFSVNAYDDA